MISGVIINIAITSITKTEVYFLANVIVSVLQLAVTLDYSLFLYHRYIEGRGKLDKEFGNGAHCEWKRLFDSISDGIERYKEILRICRLACFYFKKLGGIAGR